MRLRDLIGALDDTESTESTEHIEPTEHTDHSARGPREVPELRGDPAIEVRDVVHDSRRARPGSLFGCIPGSNTDGHDHAPAAVATGAVALLVEHFLDLDVAQVRVPSVRAALGPIASAFHGRPSRHLRVLGVTGTNGKTTTTYLLEAIANAHREKVGVVGTIETRVDGKARAPEHTTPEASDLQALLAEMRDAGVTTVAMEVSSHALDQHRVDGTRFAAVGFTNLSHDHLDYHGDVEAYFEAKASLFSPRFSHDAVVNLDDPRGAALADRAASAGMRVTSFGADPAVRGREAGADLRAEAVRLEADGSAFRLHDVRAGSVAPVQMSLVGHFNLSNALAAAGIALAGGLPFDAVVAGLAAPVVVPGRFERVDAGQDFAVIVDYAHTPDALRRLLEAARGLATPGAKVLVVFGCGGDRDRLKRPLMGAAAAAAADAVYVTSDNPRSEEPAAIVAEITAGVTPADRVVAVELDRRAAIAAALGAARPGDVVVIAGKGHEPGQTVAGVTRPFDDRLVARAELEVLRCG